jgi:hypothetical protein
MKRNWIALTGCCWALLMVTFLAGCSDKRPPVARAGGSVTLDGKPVEGVKVMFHPADGGARFSYGVTDSQGKFRLSTFGMNDGALIGRHKVAVVKVDTSSQPTFDPKELSQTGYGGKGYQDMMGVGRAKPPETKHLIPAKYANHAESGIELEVEAGKSNDFELNL